MADEVLAQLRRAFDESFARLPEVGRAEPLQFLRVQAGGSWLALRVLELDGVHVGREIAPVPGARPPLLGLGGARGQVLAVLDLAQSLGMPPPAEPPRWLAVARGPDCVALAFSRLAGALRVEAALLRERAGRDADDPLPLFLDLPGEPLPVVSVPALLAAARARLGLQEPA